MAETTTYSGKMTRTEVAEFLRSIANELDSGHGKIRIPVGNKEIQLSPPESIDTETTVTERSRRLRKDVEELNMSFDWNPTRDTAEGGSDSAPEESEPEDPEEARGPGNDSEPNR